MKRTLIVITMTSCLAGCVATPKALLALPENHLAQRQIETRRYDGIKEADLIVAASNVLQDLGFVLENTEPKLGVLTASKQRDATDGGEVVTAIALAFLGVRMAVSKDQTIRVSLVVRPAYDSTGKAMADSHHMRVTFQRIVRRSDNSVYAETLAEQALFQDFYERVSKAVFIEAQKV